MSTEQTPTRETRRPSYGNDLDTPATTNPYPRQRTYSHENVFHDQHTSKPTDTSSTRSPQRNSNVVPEQRPPARNSNEGVNAMIDTAYRRSPSPVRTSNSNNDDHRHRSTYVEEGDRSKYAYEGQKISYGSGASAMVNIPVVTQNKPAPSTLSQFQTPTEPSRDYQRSGSRSPTMTSNDPYPRQYSRERSTDPTSKMPLSIIFFYYSFVSFS